MKHSIICRDFNGKLLFFLPIDSFPRRCILCNHLSCSNSLAAFPDTQIPAESAVRIARDRRMKTMPVGTTEWDVEDYLESIRARLSPLKRFGDDLLKAATHVHKALWPEDPSPRTVKVLAERLSEGRNRLRAWRKSAARAGAEEALMWVLSWFEDLDLEKLAALREGSPWIDDPELVKKR